MRYWDGHRWTEHVADRGEASIDPLPGAAPAGGQAAAGGQAVTGEPSAAGSQQAASAGTAAATRPAGRESPDTADASQRHHVVGDDADDGDGSGR